MLFQKSLTTMQNVQQLTGYPEAQIYSLYLKASIRHNLPTGIVKPGYCPNITVNNKTIQIPMTLH